jgi:hypothetical protein
MEGWRAKSDESSKGVPPFQAKASHTDTSNLFHFITGHAFTGEYTSRFLKSQYPSPLPIDLVACPCRAMPQTIAHILRECPIYDEERAKHLTTNGRVRSLDQLFGDTDQCTRTLGFLEVTQACAKPRRSVWEPG